MIIGRVICARIRHSFTRGIWQLIWRKSTISSGAFPGCAFREGVVNCPRCSKSVGKKHCSSPSCVWGVCTGCTIVFDSAGRAMVWNGAPK